MTNRYQDQVALFFTEHQMGLVGVTEQAYAEVGGHYARLTPTERHRQAEIDSGELTEVLIRNTITLEEVEQTLHAIPSFAVLNDVIRMAEVQERLLAVFVKTHLPDQPELAHEIVARMRNLTVRFRRNLAVAHMHSLAQTDDNPATATPQV
jgi:hypothetical protein